MTKQVTKYINPITEEIFYGHIEPKIKLIDGVVFVQVSTTIDMKRCHWFNQEALKNKGKINT